MKSKTVAFKTVVPKMEATTVPSKNKSPTCIKMHKTFVEIKILRGGTPRLDRKKTWQANFYAEPPNPHRIYIPKADVRNVFFALKIRRTIFNFYANFSMQKI